MKQTALITGASNGIGYELAKIMAKAGYNLVLVARNDLKMKELKERLESKHAARIVVIQKDLAVKNSAAQIYQELQEKEISVNVLVNNAGFGLYGYFSTTDWKREEEMLQLNIVTLTQLTKLFLPQMIANGSGRIMNVASVAAFMPGPLMSVYYASKSYVLSLSEAIASELRGTGVTVTTLCPGPVATNFGTTAGLGEKLLKNNPVATAYDVAMYGYRAMLRGQTVAIYNLLFKFLVFASRFLPRKMVTCMVKKMQE